MTNFRTLTVGSKSRLLVSCAIGLVCALAASATQAKSIRFDGSPAWTPTTTDPYPSVAASDPGSGTAGDTVSFATCSTSDGTCADAFSDFGNNFSGFAVTGGTEFNWMSGSTLVSQVVVWTLADITNGSTDLGAGFELELDGWCPGGSSSPAPSLSWGGTTYNGGCSSITNDLLFNSSGLVGYVNDSSDTGSDNGCNQGNASTCTVTFATTLPTDWTTGTVTSSAPEPDTLALIGLAVLPVLLIARRRRARAA